MMTETVAERGLDHRSGVLESPVGGYSTVTLLARLRG